MIAELKKASPSKGMIREDFDYLGILGQYEQAGASCISCLTEPAHFLGSTEILRDVCSNTKLPVLCKDFTVDEYQIYEACAGGASAVLLIAALLSEKQIGSMLETADSLAMSALVETHSAEEIEKAVNAGARVIRDQQPSGPEELYGGSFEQYQAVGSPSPGALYSYRNPV